MIAKLPEDFVKDPTRRVSDLQPGETGWIEHSDMIVDPQRQCFVDPKAVVHQEANFMTIHIKRTEEGVDVLIPAKRLIPFDWEPGAFRVEESYLPVVKLKIERKK